MSGRLRAKRKQIPPDTQNADDLYDSAKKRKLVVVVDKLCCDSKLRVKGKQISNVARRSSIRLQQKRNTSTPGNATLTDSAYDGDEECSPSSTQSEEDDSYDPYSISMLEDVPVVQKAREKKREKTSHKGAIVGEMKRSKKNKGPGSEIHQSSTPNLTNQNPLRRSTRRCRDFETTPEVTPILPVSSIRVPPSPPAGAQSFSTPKVLMTRLRDNQSSILSSSSPYLQVSSQADSGISLSPGTKHTRIKPSQVRRKSAAGVVKKFMNKRNIFSPNSKQAQNQKEVVTESKENLDNSCFGFNSLDSPLVRDAMKKGSVETTELGVYRSTQPVVMSDSSPTSPLQPVTSSDSENTQEASPQGHWPSPGLFSDDMFSTDAESLSLNRSTVKTYRPVKFKPSSKPRTSVNKFEVWAHEKNMEIEDIEKFDLNIE